MANILSPKLVTLTFPALAFILSLCVFNCLFSVVAVGSSDSEDPDQFKIPPFPPTPKEGCDSDGDCINHPSNASTSHCWNRPRGSCHYCEDFEKFDDKIGQCEEVRDENVTRVIQDAIKTGIVLSVVLGIVILLSTTACCVTFCFYCDGWPGYEHRKRRNQKEQPAQMIANPNPCPAYSQHKNPSQNLYQYAAPPPPYTNVYKQYPNAPPPLPPPPPYNVYKQYPAALAQAQES